MQERFTNVYHRNLDAYLDKDIDLIVNQGGTSSGKTYGILQLLDQIAMLKKGVVITVLSHSVPHLKIGALRDMETIYASTEREWEANFNKTDKLLTYPNGSIIEFISADKMKSHGGRRDILFINEANFIEFEVFRQLFVRTRLKTFIDYNPMGEFWYHSEINPNPKQYKHTFIHSTYKDNPYIDKNSLHVLLNAKEGTNFWRIYVMGEVGVAVGVVFNNWKRGEWDDTLPYVYGVDFGFHPDPDAIVKVAYSRKENKIYIEEKHYKKENGTADFIRACKQIVAEDLEREKLNPYYTRAPWAEPKARSLFVCEYASGGSRMIADMRNALLNAIPCQKLPIQERIKLMQNMEIILCGDSPNIERELNNYIFNDVKAGIPIDKWNHAIDAIAYAWEFLVRGISRSQKR